MSDQPQGVRRARLYAGLYDRLRGTGDRGRDMRLVADALWESLLGTGLSWIGFYTIVEDRREMVLGPSRDTPACSPIGLHGMCGRCYLERRPILVGDVATLGDHYIACDPRDRSEAVVPLFEADGSCWGVLDADSHEKGGFDTTDITGLTGLVELVGLSIRPDPAPEILSL